MRKKLKIAIISILIIIFCIIAFLLFSNDNTELKTIKSDKELSGKSNCNGDWIQTMVAGSFEWPGTWCGI